MDSARWERVQELFHRVADLPQTAQRAELRSSGADEALVADVLALLDEDARAGSVLDAAVGSMAGDVFEPPELGPAGAAELAPYRIVRLLGEGGMGVVYLAERTDLGSKVAIKFLRDAWLSPARRERFAAEQRTLARLDHPGIARIYDAGTVGDGTPYFVMEYVEGAPITHHCAERRADLAERLRLFRALCEAVRDAHRHAVIHRDIKPSNVLVKRDGSLRLLDFGIAKQLDTLDEAGTRTGLRFWTPAYAAPEQARGERVGTYSDVYSLGVVLYELLAARLPFPARPTMPALAAASLPTDEKPDPPSAAARQTGASGLAGKATWADLDVLVLRAIQAEPDRRYATVEALIRDIDHLVAGEPLDARPDRLGYRLRKFAVRHRGAVSAAALGLAAAVALVAFFLWRLTLERDHAEEQAAIANAVVRFLSEDLLGRNNPLLTGKSAETLPETIAHVIPDIDRQFAHQPRVAARLHGAVARALDARTDYALARQEYLRADELYRRVDGPGSDEAIFMRLLRAGMEARLPDGRGPQLATTLLAAEQKLIAERPNPRPDLPILVHRIAGALAMQAGDAKGAAHHFQAALDLGTKLPGLERSERLLHKQMLAWAYLRLAEGAKAEHLFRELIADFSELRGETGPNVMLLRQNLGQALLQQKKTSAALDEARAIYPHLVAMLGKDHLQTIQTLGLISACEGWLGQWDAAIRDSLEVHRLAAARYGADSQWAIVGAADAGMFACRRGSFVAGEAHARTAFEAARAQYGDKGALTGAIAMGLAGCLIGLGKLDDAERLLGDIDVAAVSGLLGNNQVEAEIALLRADIAIRRGRFQEARKLLEPIVPVFTRLDAEPYQRGQLEALLARAREGARVK